MRILCFCLSATVMILLASSGCKPPPRSAYAPYTGPTSARPADRVGNVFPAVGRGIHGRQMEQLGLLYIEYWGASPRGPSKIEDLGLDKPDGRQILKLINDGEIVVVWNVSDNNTNCQILAYEKATPTQGGLALRRDGSVGSITAEEFKEYQKAFPPQK